MKRLIFFIFILFITNTLFAQHQIEYWENNNKKSEGPSLTGKKTAFGYITIRMEIKKWKPTTKKE